MQKFNVMVFERKRDTSGGRLVEHNGKKVPEDSIPKKLPSFAVNAVNHDAAKRAARQKLERDGRTVVGISFSGEVDNGIVVYVYEKG